MDDENGAMIDAVLDEIDADEPDFDDNYHQPKQFDWLWKYLDEPHQKN